MAASDSPFNEQIAQLDHKNRRMWALNGLLLVQYQTFMHGLRTVAPYPDGWYGLYAARFMVPIALARRWLLR